MVKGSVNEWMRYDVVVKINSSIYGAEQYDEWFLMINSHAKEKMESTDKEGWFCWSHWRKPTGWVWSQIWCRVYIFIVSKFVLFVRGNCRLSPSCSCDGFSGLCGCWGGGSWG